MIVMTVLAYLMEVPGIVTVDVYQQATLVMTVMTVPVFPMAVMLKTTVMHVIVMLLMTVCRIVLVIGVVF